jgi:hypothetical protein
MLLLWPAYVVGMGLLVGAAVARLTQTTHPQQVRSILAAVGFGNSTGLPIKKLAAGVKEYYGP